MSAISEYLKETRAELRHVAWPSQAQTIVYTVLVALISLFIAAYLGVFDFLFTNALTQVVNKLPAQNQAVVTQISTSTATVATTSIPTATTTTK